MQHIKLTIFLQLVGLLPFSLYLGTDSSAESSRGQYCSITPFLLSSSIPYHPSSMHPLQALLYLSQPCPCVGFFYYSISFSAIELSTSLYHFFSFFVWVSATTSSAFCSSLHITSESASVSAGQLNCYLFLIWLEISLGGVTTQECMICHGK